MGVYEVTNRRDHVTKTRPNLSSHILPSVSIRYLSLYICFFDLTCQLSFVRPALVVENIPGLYFIGNQKKLNNKIKVEHVINEASAESVHDEISVTDSTTSKFEKMEKMVEKQESGRNRDDSTSMRFVF